VLRLRGGYPRSAYTRCWQRYSERHSPGLVPVRPGGLPGCRLPRQHSWLHVLGLVQQQPFGVQEVESGVLRLRRWCTKAASAGQPDFDERDSSSLVPVCPGGVPGGRVPRQQSRLHMLGLVQQHRSGVAAVESRMLRLRSDSLKSGSTLSPHEGRTRVAPGQAAQSHM